MKKLYKIILLITLALFFSCDEKKATNEIKKALDKTVEEKDKTTKPANPQGSGTPTNTKGEDAGDEEADDIPPQVLIKPALSDKLAPWSEPILFQKVAGHTYKLKEEKTGVAITEYSSETMQVTATQSAQNVIIVATSDGGTSESNPIEFIRIPGNTLSFNDNLLTLETSNILTIPATKSGTVAGDTRNIRYSLSPTGQGVTIDSSSGKITVSSSVTEREYIITAELPQDEKYERSTATRKLLLRKGSGTLTNTEGEEVRGDTPPPPAPTLTKPVLSSESAPWSELISFPKILGHTYELKEEKPGVELRETEDNSMYVYATQSVQNVVIVATLDGNTEDSDPIEFTRIPGNTLSFAEANRDKYKVVHLLKQLLKVRQLQEIPEI